jgi:hypothetical protein
VTGGLKEPDALELLGHPDEYVRSWAIYLLVATKQPSDEALRRFARLARHDPSALVRLYLASALQRTPAARRWDILSGLMAHPEDAGDQNLPLMVWYAAEPLADIDMARALTLTLESKLPQTFSFMVQRIASARTPEALRVLAERLVRTDNPSQQAELIKGLNQVISPPPMTVR